MRIVAPLFALGLVVVGLLGCSENSLSNLPPTPEAEEVISDIPPLPEPEPTALEPIADAGPNRLYATGAPVQLDGSGSYDPQSADPLTYAWTLLEWPNGSSVQVVGLDTVAPSFTADVEGSFRFELTVMNSAGLWDATPAAVTIDAEQDPVLEPVADAGSDQVLDEGSVAQLDATASFDPQGLEPLTFAWQIVQRPVGSVATLSDPAAATPTLTIDTDGLFVFEMTVRNSVGIWDSTADQVTITANDVTLPPVADAGIDMATSSGTNIQLDGTASYDPQGLAPLSYSWAITDRPPGSTTALSGASSEHPTLTPDIPGTYSIELTVGNTLGYWDQTPDKVYVEVTEVMIQEPVADAGADFGVLPLEQVNLVGTGSYDPAGLEPLVWDWRIVSRPAGSLAQLSDLDAANPGFFADLAGAYVMELTVMNSAGVWDTTPDLVTVEAIPIDGFYVEVSWDAENDLDLHILQNGAALWSDGDANYCNMTPEWGGAGTQDNPSLDADAIQGFGPETTTIESPATGSYEVAVHYYGLNGGSDCGSFSCPVAIATVKIYVGGVLQATLDRQMDTQGQVWTAARIDVPSGQITPVDQMGSTTETYCN